MRRMMHGQGSATLALTDTTRTSTPGLSTTDCNTEGRTMIAIVMVSTSDLHLSRRIILAWLGVASSCLVRYEFRSYACLLPLILLIYRTVQCSST